MRAKAATPPAASTFFDMVLNLAMTGNLYLFQGDTQEGNAIFFY